MTCVYICIHTYIMHIMCTYICVRLSCITLTFWYIKTIKYRQIQTILWLRDIHFWCMCVFIYTTHTSWLLMLVDLFLQCPVSLENCPKIETFSTPWMCMRTTPRGKSRVGSVEETWGRYCSHYGEVTLHYDNTQLMFCANSYTNEWFEKF